MSEAHSGSGRPAPDVTVIVVNWNGARWLPRCLRSILDQTGLDLEVVVVDNASTDDSVALVREQFPTVELIVNPTNTGFAVANNQAMRVSRGRYVLLLNNDAWLEPDTTRQLVALADQQPNIGMVGARILTDDGVWQPAYGPTLTLGRLLFASRRAQPHINRQAGGQEDAPGRRAAAESGQADYSPDWPIEYVTGLCILVKRALLAEVGLLDEGFFMYYEDMDWGVRARRAGWQIAYCPQAIVHHAYRRVDQKAKPRNLEAEIRRSQVRFARKHLGIAATWIVALLGLGYLAWSWLRSSLVWPRAPVPAGGARAGLQSAAAILRELFGGTVQRVDRL